MVKTVDLRIDGRKVEKLLPNIIAVDFIERERYDYRLAKFKKDKPKEFFNYHAELVDVLGKFKQAADLNILDGKRRR